MSNQAIQEISKLILGGMTKDQVADSLGITPDMVEAILVTNREDERNRLRGLSSDELLNDAKPRAVSVLIELLDNSDNPHIQLKAAIAILNNGKDSIVVNNEKLDGVIQQMQTLANKYNSKIIDIPSNGDNNKDNINKALMKANANANKSHCSNINKKQEDVLIEQFDSMAAAI